MKKILVTLGLVVLIVLGYIVFGSEGSLNRTGDENSNQTEEVQEREDYVVNEENNNKLPEGVGNGGGILEAVDTSCFADGVCTATVEGETIVLLEGWNTETVGEIRFEDGIGGLEAHIGSPVIFIAAETETGYTLYGSEDYYIEPAM